MPGGAFLQPVHFLGQLAHLKGVADRDDDPLRTGRFDEEVLGAGLHRLHHHVHPAGRGEDHHRGGQSLGAHGLKRLDTGHVGHDHVEDHHVGRQAGGHTGERCLAGIGLGDGEALPLENRLHKAALGGIVSITAIPLPGRPGLVSL